MCELGVVVVGVGVAGGVRIRDILNPHPELKGVTLKGFVSRREIEIEGATRVPLEAALADPSVNAVIVCTENNDHQQTTRQVLAAGKHALVEFPLATDYSALAPLYELANKQGVVLYEEDIALLTPQHEAVKATVGHRAPDLVQIDLSIDGSLRVDESEYLRRAGHPLYSGISLLQRAMDVAGDLTPAACSTNIDPDAGIVEATAELRTKFGGKVNIRYSKRKTEKPQRVTKFCYKFMDGSEITQDTELGASQHPGKIGLFMKDLVQFTEVVRGTRNNDSRKWLTQRSIEITSQLIQMSNGSSDTA